MRENKKMSFNELIYALENTHTLSIRDVCKILKCSRNWVNQYISFSIKDKIFLNQNIEGKQDKENAPNQKSLPKTNWVKVVSAVLGRNIVDSIWFNNEEFLNLMNNSIASYSVQTKMIPIEKCVINEESFIKEYQKLQEEFETVRKTLSIPLIDNHLIKMKNCIEENLSICGKMLYENQVKVNKRSTVPHYLLSKKFTNDELFSILLKMESPHDIKEYGDTDELIYRKFFKEGYERIEFNLKNVEGKLSKKIYYIKPEQEESESAVGIYITIPYQQFIMCFANNKKINKSKSQKK